MRKQGPCPFTAFFLASKGSSMGVSAPAVYFRPEAIGENTPYGHGPHPAARSTASPIAALISQVSLDYFSI
ncbi:MAG: hypothetical protein AAGU23_08395 [Bacillota bacterium]